MINFAFCYEREEELRFVKDEILKCFKVRDIKIAIKAYRNAYELIRCLDCNCPDVLFYNIDDEDGLIHKAALLAKQTNKRLIPVITDKSNFDLCDSNPLFDCAFTLPSMTRKHLWMYATLAYEAFKDDSESFTYYVRPDYVHVPIRDIIYFASEGRRVHLVTNRKRDSFYQKLDEIENLIKQKSGNFLRIHQSYLVNSHYISNYSQNHVTLLTGDRLRVSKYEYYRNLNENFQNGESVVKKIACYC